MYGLRRTVIYIERDTKLLKAFFDLFIVFVNDLLRGDALFFCTDGNRRTMLI